jgi:hypothetical protein
MQDQIAKTVGALLIGPNGKVLRGARLRMNGSEIRVSEFQA